MIERSRIENERYWEIYHVRKDNMKNYDLVIDTSKITPEEVADKIIEKYLNWKQN